MAVEAGYRARSPMRSVTTALLAAAALLAGCGSTSHTADRDAQARAGLLRAANDIHTYGRVHHTYDVGGVAGLHRLDPATAIVNFVDGRQTSFFIAVEPPTTKTIWRYDYDHHATNRAECLPRRSRKCVGMKRW